VIDETSALAGLAALDSQVITTIHDRYFPELYRYARYRVGDASTAEDIAAEAFVRLLEAAHARRGPRSSLRGWLLGTTSHLINDHFRRSYTRREQTLPDHLVNPGAGPDAHAEQADRTRRLRDAVQRLTFDQQHVLALRFGNGFTLEETATLMSRKANAIKALQFRALSALRRQLKDPDE
jgi:RNA polymerase sigma-70 factor (ECF subfamily)